MKKGTKLICIHDYCGIYLKNEIYYLVDFNDVALGIANTMNASSFHTIDRNKFRNYFITAAEFREKRIDSILND